MYLASTNCLVIIIKLNMKSFKIYTTFLPYLNTDLLFFLFVNSYIEAIHKLSH